VPAEAAGTADRRRSASRVLIVDDQRANSDLIRAMLESVDLPADFARSGEEAVALAAASRYALILMDLQLPTCNCRRSTASKPLARFACCRRMQPFRSSH